MGDRIPMVLQNPVVETKNLIDVGDPHQRIRGFPDSEGHLMTGEP